MLKIFKLTQKLALLLLGVCTIQACHSKQEEAYMYQGESHIENIKHPNKTYATAEGHKVTFSTNEDGSPIALVTYALPEGFSCTKKLPIVESRKSTLASINNTHSTSLIRLAKNKDGKQVILIGSISLKGGMPGDDPFGIHQKSSLDRMTEKFSKDVSERPAQRESSHRESAQRSDMESTFREHGVEFNSRQSSSGSSSYSSGNSGGLSFFSNSNNQNTGPNLLRIGNSLGLSPQMTLGSLWGGSSSSLSGLSGSTLGNNTLLGTDTLNNPLQIGNTLGLSPQMTLGGLGILGQSNNNSGMLSALLSSNMQNTETNFLKITKPITQRSISGGGTITVYHRNELPYLISGPSYNRREFYIDIMNGKLDDLSENPLSCLNTDTLNLGYRKGRGLLIPDDYFITEKSIQVIPNPGKTTVYILRFKQTSTCTISTLLIPGKTSTDDPPIYLLEPEGPDTYQRNQDKRIPEGKYKIIPQEGWDPKNTKKPRKVPWLYNSDVAIDRGILIHAGMARGNTTGCLMPGKAFDFETNRFKRMDDILETEAYIEQIFSTIGYENIEIYVINLFDK
jgi:hypothetical protein